MSIREQVEDAIFLANNGRHVGALTIMMLAIAASSRKVFPQGTMSLKEPKKGKPEKMYDEEAFTLYLGGRIRTLLFNPVMGAGHGDSGVMVSFRGQMLDLAYILYKYYRCALIHEANLPEDVEFISTENDSSVTVITKGDKLALGHGWIHLLIDSVVNDPCNAKEFGIKHYKLSLNPEVDEQAFINTLTGRYGVCYGRYAAMKEALFLLSDDTINQSSDTDLIGHFQRLVDSGEIIGGMITGLSIDNNLTDRSGKLQPNGVAMLRDMANSFKKVEI
ncbi:hypothetical protein [Pseudomonas jessenii]|uniref:hypothetical protein n=1 Tax=Pseudomonas jessenii TaxID=77298 RepID=UPI0030C22778